MQPAPLPRHILLPLAVLVLPVAARAADESPLEALRADSEIAKAIEKLDANMFAARNEASRMLEDAGRSAIGPITDAALGDSREVTMRCLDILKKHFNSEDEQLQEAAKEALQTIVDSKHEIAAHRAKDVLEPKPPQQLNAAPGFGIMPGQIQIQINAIGGAQKRQIRVNNGVKTVEVEEKGQKIKITEDPAKGIEIEVTEKKDGKETTEKYAAKSADELKKNHPEAHKLYEKHAKQMGGGIQVRAMQIQPGAMPLRIPAAVPAIPAAAKDPQRRMAATMLDHARRMIENSTKQLERIKQGADDKEELEASIKRLSEIQQSLKEEHAKLNKG
jgi:hypothetical protein